MILGARIARQTLNVGQARTLTVQRIARSRRQISTEDIADTLGALLVQSVAKEARFARLATEAFRIEQALDALASAGVTVARLRQVNVVVTLARTALTACHVRIAEIVIGADIATRSGVSFLALAYNVLRSNV